MTKNLIIIGVLLILSKIAFPLEIKANLWTKDICQTGAMCLPKAYGESQQFNIPEPQDNSFSRITSSFGEYNVTFTFTKRIAPTPYYSFQIEIGSQTYPALAVCSRFEALDTMENAMVGACAGKIPYKNELIGVSLVLPE